MKKIIALVIAILMIAALAIPAMAEDADPEVAANEKDFNNAGGDATTRVEFGVDGAYTVTIPVTVSFVGLEAEASVSASGVIIAGNQTFTVTVDSAFYGTTDAGDWVMKEETSKSDPVDYTIHTATKDEETEEVTPVTEVVAKTTPILTITKASPLTTDGIETSGYKGSVLLAFATEGTSQVGSYYDVLTFTVAIA